MKTSKTTLGEIFGFWQCPRCGALNSRNRSSCGNTPCYQPRPPQFGVSAQQESILTTSPAKDAGAASKRPGNGKESELQAACEKWLRYHGIEYLHLSPMAREKIGWPDLVFCYAGKPIAVELKSATGKLKPEQAELLERMKQNGWLVCVCRTLQEFIDFVNATETPF